MEFCKWGVQLERVLLHLNFGAVSTVQPQLKPSGWMVAVDPKSSRIQPLKPGEMSPDPIRQVMFLLPHCQRAFCPIVREIKEAEPKRLTVSGEALSVTRLVSFHRPQSLRVWLFEERVFNPSFTPENRFPCIFRFPGNTMYGIFRNETSRL